jgi:hypothetical protein
VLLLRIYTTRRDAPAKALEALVKLGIAREITGGQSNRLFAYDAYLAVLSEGAEPL